MRVERRCLVEASRDRVWELVSDSDRYPSFMPNLARWETITDGPMRVGARYTVHWQIGSVPVGGVVEVVEFDECRDLAWTSITGITMRGRFRLRDAGDGRTTVTFRLSYQAPGGVLGLIADRVATRQVRRNLAATLQRLREHAATDQPGETSRKGESDAQDHQTRYRQEERTAQHAAKVRRQGAADLRQGP